MYLTLCGFSLRKLYSNLYSTKYFCVQSLTELLKPQFHEGARADESHIPDKETSLKAAQAPKSAVEQTPALSSSDS